MKFVLTILLIVSFNSLFGSIIYHQNFDLFKYDRYERIYEIEVIDTIPEKPKLGEENYFDSLISITIDFTYKKYKIKIKTLIKGVVLNDTIFDYRQYKGKERLLKIGESYIVYDSDSLRKDAQFYYDGYNKEIENLQKLSKKQSYIVLDNGKQKIAEGNYKRGKRHGIWKLYYSVPFYFNSDSETIVFIELKYRRGKIIGMKNFINEEYFNYDDYFNKESEWFYYSLLSKKGRKNYQRNNPMLYQLVR